MPKSSLVAFKCNKYGHLVFELTGHDFFGSEEVEWLRNAGYRVTDNAEWMFTNKKSHSIMEHFGSYNTNHRLISGCRYSIALIQGKEIDDSVRTTKNLRNLGISYGYSKPLAGLLPRIRETISDELMEEIGVWHITVPHHPITGTDGEPCVLRSSRGNGGSLITDYWDPPDNLLDSRGAFAFPFEIN